MSTDLLNQFNFPDVAREDFINKGLVAKQIAPMVNSYEMQGSDRGVAYRFFIVPVKNEMKSEAADMEINDEVEMIEWFKDRKNRPTERVRFLPPQLLKFNKQGECTGGLYQEAYLRFKKGLTASGLPLERWEKLSIGQIATLKAEGIFTVEQFAALPKDRIEDRFPKDLKEAFYAAIHLVNRLNVIEDVEKHAGEAVELKQRLAKAEQENQELREKLLGKPEKKKAGRPKKVVLTDEEKDGEEWA